MPAKAEAPSTLDLEEQRSKRSVVHGYSSRLGQIFFFAICVFLLGSIFGFELPSWWPDHFLSIVNDRPTSQPTCKNPRIRKEWRSLSKPERHDYFDAVYCLLQEPPVMANRSLYDDFPYVHADLGRFVHDSALFLPWHRAFISAYEESLASKCGYMGALPYWDWTLDWEDLTKAPVFDDLNGFGGDGNATGELTVGRGRCIVDGVFEGVMALRYDTEYAPHCLSRGFLPTKYMERMAGTDCHPDAIAKALAQPTFETFLRELEGGVHGAVAVSIGGDWEKHTAPNDPLWWLHHAQLDRLWWLWQRGGPGRLAEYSGRANNLTESPAAVTDMIETNGLFQPLQVAQVLGTESEILCYRYE